MKKFSKASLIIAIILIVCAVALNVLGFVNMNRMYFTRHLTGHGFMSMSYVRSYSLSGTSMAMIVAGGFLFVGGILLLTSSKHEELGSHCCHKAVESKPESKEDKPEDKPEYQTPSESL